VSAAPTTDEAGELQALYGRYKTITLSTGASLLLDGDVEELARRVDELIVDCGAAQERGGVHIRQLAACRDATLDLQPLLDGDTTEHALERARASHRRLRRAVWDVIPCEYVPCCAPGHDHDEG
jgi:hypothetical protein